MSRQRDWEEERLLNAIWILLAAGLVLLLLSDAALLEVLAPIGCVVLLWWVASGLITQLSNADPHHVPTGIRCSRHLLKEYRRAQRGLGQLTRLRQEAESALEELRRAGAAEREACVARARSELTDLHHTLQHQAARARLIVVSMEAAEWLERTAPLLDRSRWRRSQAAQRVDCIAREHPYGVRILLRLEADAQTLELPAGRALRDLLKARLNDLYRTQVDVEADCAHRLAKRMAVRSAWASGDRSRESLKRCLRKHRHRNSVQP